MNNHQQNTTSDILSAKKIASLGILTAFALISFLLENLLPALPIPGARLGIGNVFVMAALVLYSPIEAFFVMTARTALGAIFVGNLSQLLYSFSGGICSLCLASALLYTLYPRVSLVAISVCSAVCHNVVQGLVFTALSGTVLTLSYLPWLIALGACSGCVVGLILYFTICKTPLSLWERLTSSPVGRDK